MQVVSESVRALLDAHAKVTLAVYIDGEKLEAGIGNASYTGACAGDDEFSFGNACAAGMTISLAKALHGLKGRSISVSWSINGVEYPLLTGKVNRYKIAAGRTEVEAWDTMYFAGSDVFELTESVASDCTAQTAFLEVSSAMGVEAEQASLDLLAGVAIPGGLAGLSSDVTNSAVAGYIAGLVGGNALMSRDGLLCIKQYVETGWETEPYSGGASADNEDFSVTGITLQRAEVVAESNSDGTSTEKSEAMEFTAGDGALMISNPLASQVAAERAYIALQAVTVRPGNYSFPGGLLLEPGDIFTIHTMDGSYSVAVSSISLSFDGGVKASVACGGEADECGAKGAIHQTLKTLAADLARFKKLEAENATIVRAFIDELFVKSLHAEVIHLLTGEGARPYFESWDDLDAFIAAEVDTMEDYTKKSYSLILDAEPIYSSCVLEIARGRDVDLLADVIVTLISKAGIWLRYANDEGSSPAEDWYWRDWVALGDGATVIPGEDGKSAYEIAVEHGFEGTEEEWLASLQGGSAGGSEVLLGQTPYTMKESASVKLVGSGEHSYTIKGKTVADLSTMVQTGTSATLTKNDNYIELVSTGGANWYNSYVTLSVTGLTAGTAYVLAVSGMGVSLANLVSNGYFIIKNASGTQLAIFGPESASLESVEFTPDTTSISIVWYPAAYYYWTNNCRTARIADIYINEAADGTARTDVLNESGTFTDSFVLGQVSAGVTITTDPSCQVYKITGGSSGAALPLAGKTVVCFGDSLFGMYTGDTSAPAYVAERTGATVHNVGFGGCRMSVHPTTGYAEFCMWALAKAIASGDWSAQDAAASSGSSNFPDQLAILKEIDFADVDYVVIHYGTNDFTAGAGVAIDNASDPDDYNTLCGALRYSIETLLAAYPELRIFVSVPAFRYWTADDGTVTYPEDYTNVNGNTLIEFVEAISKTAGEYNLPVIDSYYGLGINKINAATFLADGVHHNVTGRKRFGDFIGSCLVAPPVRLGIDTITAKVIEALPIYNGEVEEV